MYEASFSKENLDRYLKELSKEYRKQNGTSSKAEIILIGGAAVLIGYGFRDMTTDIDAIIRSSSSMKDAIILVGDRFHLPEGWLNDDFKKTSSYTPKILQYSKYYRTYSNVIEFRIMTGEYLLAMKMKAGREYKFDRSDIIGILWEQEKKGDPLTLGRIRKAIEDLYDSYDVISEDVRIFLEKALQNGHYGDLYARVRQSEKENKSILLEYQAEKPGVLSQDNVHEVIQAIKKRKGQET